MYSVRQLRVLCGEACEGHVQDVLKKMAGLGWKFLQKISCAKRIPLWEFHVKIEGKRQHQKNEISQTRIPPTACMSATFVKIFVVKITTLHN